MAHSRVNFTSITYQDEEQNIRVNSLTAILLHDNAHLHAAHRVQVQMNVKGWVALKHPAYSPDLSIHDFYVFGTLMKVLKGIHIGSQCAGGCGTVV
jgi:hypothetical protein